MSEALTLCLEPGKQVSAMASTPGGQVGSVYLFIKSDSTSLCAQYHSSKSPVYNALRDALSANSRNATNSPEILKIFCSDPHLILHLKFCGEETCLQFIRNYRDRRLFQHIQDKLRHCLAMASLQVFLELKVDSEKLDMILDEEEKCLERILSFKPSYVKDEELVKLENNLTNLHLGSSYPEQNSISLSSPSGNSFLGSAPRTLRSISETGTFQFQGLDYADRPLTSEHQQMFAKMVGKPWKKVGRVLKRNCKALEDPAIDNLAYEYSGEGLYEQAYQLLKCFMDCEGRKATLKRLVDALVECELTGVAEKLMCIQES
ncbi:tumor necrosis factor receptor type 1-associated DEATH domain protein [Gastrophryne carolinensis]